MSFWRSLDRDRHRARLRGDHRAYARPLDDLLMRALMCCSRCRDRLALVLAASSARARLLVIAVDYDDAPRGARHARRGVEDRGTGFVGAAEVIGFPRRRSCPARSCRTSQPDLVETTLRLTSDVAAVAGLSFLGFGFSLRPRIGPDDDENRIGYDPAVAGAVAGDPIACSRSGRAWTATASGQRSASRADRAGGE